MEGRYRSLDHTADAGIVVTADDLGGLIADAAYGMFDLMLDLTRLEPNEHIEVAVAGTDPANLLVEALSELLYRSEIDDLALCEFTPLDAPEAGVTLRVGAAPIAEVELIGPPIKAVTYHDLVVEQVGDRWEARVIFDV